MSGIKEDAVKSEIDRLLSKPIDDEGKVLEIIVQAITSKYAQPEVVEKAVRQAVFNYEVQMRIYQIAIAKRQLSRIVRLMNMTESMEQFVMSPEVMAKMEAKDLINLYGKANTAVKDGLEYIKRVVDARIEATAAQTAMMETINQREVATVDIAGISNLTTQQRDKVRRIVDGIVDDLDNINEGTAKLLEEPDEGDGNGHGGNGTSQFGSV